jgi:quinol-cytochrome oxidoreductase complex cytochrome b subunit
MRGGVELGALTLLRWYTAHVFLLPAALIGFVVAHIYLMRRHGISGPIAEAAGQPKPFYPYQARSPIRLTRPTCRGPSGISSACSSC